MTSARPRGDARGGGTLRRATLARLAPSFGGLLGILLLPKCPLCLAALFGIVGLGTGAATSLAPLLWPAALLLATSSLLTLAWSAWRARGRRHQAAPCCSVGANRGPLSPTLSPLLSPLRGAREKE